MDEISIREKLKRYETIINTYKYITEDEVNSMIINSHVIYISKVGFKKKSGYLKSIRSTSILELYSFGRVWNIYLNKYYIFNRERINKMKLLLQKLVDNDFKTLTITQKDENDDIK